jgi:cardiolipin synthase
MHDALNWTLLYGISQWVIRVAMLIYVPQRRTAAASRTWLLLILFLPWPGLIAYAVFGRIYVSKHRIDLQLVASRHIRAVQAQMAQYAFERPTLPPDMEMVVSLAARLGDFKPWGGNAVELLSDYKGAIDRLIVDIEAAQHHVHLLYYIFGDDAYGHLVVDALVRAVKRGVQCRVLMDAIGSKRALKTLAPQMRVDGIEVLAMLPFHLFRRNTARFDLRNHRKLAVIDGRIGHTGSQNIVDPEFVKGYPNEELNFRVIGPVVAQLQAVFIADHYMEAGVSLEAPVYFPELREVGEVVAQVVPSGPGYPRENGQELMITLLYSAKTRVVITTPYFVPDEPFLHAVRSASIRGVEVHLILSAHANQPVTQYAQRSYYDDLLNAGVKIHFYQPHFLHAKHFTVDDHTVLIGSTNIDIRSFALNSELNLLVCDLQVAEQLKALQQRYLDHSQLLDPVQWRNRPLLARTLQNIARLADSFL